MEVSDCHCVSHNSWVKERKYILKSHVNFTLSYWFTKEFFAKWKVVYEVLITPVPTQEYP